MTQRARLNISGCLFGKIKGGKGPFFFFFFYPFWNTAVFRAGSPWVHLTIELARTPACLRKLANVLGDSLSLRPWSAASISCPTKFHWHSEVLMWKAILKLWMLWELSYQNDQDRGPNPWNFSFYGWAYDLELVSKAKYHFLKGLPDWIAPFLSVDCDLSGRMEGRTIIHSGFWAKMSFLLIARWVILKKGQRPTVAWC